MFNVFSISFHRLSVLELLDVKTHIVDFHFRDESAITFLALHQASIPRSAAWLAIMIRVMRFEISGFNYRQSEKNC